MSVRVLTLVALVVLAAAATPLRADRLKIQADWKGESNDKVAKLVADALVVGTQEEWEKFWAAAKPGQKAPAVDFKAQAVVVLVGPNINVNFLELTGGDLRPDADATFTGNATFHAVAFDRKGVKSVWKKPLKD